ncbi:MAG: hypothetical protein GY762_06370 [Proteobacteria bacterium]|nr:hypothetical protein [Pseudomonadota bacterium]
MRSVILAVIVCCVISGCPETTKYCDDACTIWDDHECYYEYDDCMDECEADKDWDKPYLRCLERADDCYELNACG